MRLEKRDTAHGIFGINQRLIYHAAIFRKSNPGLLF